MGFPVDLFVDKPDDEFICSICEHVFKDPVMIGTCEHVFCRECINDWNNKSSSKDTCPLDSKNFGKITAPPKVMITFLNRLKLRCQFKKFGCGEIPTIEGITEHLKLCQFDPNKRIKCAAGCGAKFWSFELETHNCLEYLKNEFKQQTRKIADLKGKCYRNRIECGGCGAKITKNEVHHCLEYLKARVNEQKLEIADLKKEHGSTDDGDDKELPVVAPIVKRPGVYYAVCISECSGRGDFLTFKLGETVEIVKINFGEGTHLAVKDGKHGLVPIKNVQLSTYENVFGVREIAQCTESRSYSLSPSILVYYKNKNLTPPSHPMVSFKLLDIIQIICKDVPFWDDGKDQTGWLVELNGHVGYFFPKYAQITKQCIVKT